MKRSTALPEYPKRGFKFSTFEEIDEYLAHKKVECLLCGRRLAHFGTHLAYKHEMTVHEYKAEFGIPFTRGLAGEGVVSSVSRRMRAKMAALSHDEKHRLIEAARERTPSEPNRGHTHSPAIRHKLSRMAEKGRESNNFIANWDKDKTESAPCSSCGQRMLVSRNAAVTAIRRLKCKQCKTTNLKRWKVRTGMTKMKRAIDPEYFIRFSLRLGPMIASEIIRNGANALIGSNTLRRAAKRLGVSSIRHESSFLWSLPSQPPAGKPAALPESSKPRRPASA